nr:tRNA (guanosine(46)-N7)-methyltransferase TrmB [uncultured Dethiosulfovibrio sp.]
MKRTDVLLEPASSGLPVLSSQDSRAIAEIGFGNGEFLIHLAKEERDCLVFGMEISMTCAEKAIKRALREGVPNVRIIRGDARFLLRECFEDESLEKIYMSFPCPWPKERHSRRRVTHKGFSDTVASVLKVGGEFELATDEEWYAQEVGKVLGGHPSLDLVSFDVNKRRKITTKYERKWLDQGKDTFILVFEKKGKCTVSRTVEGGLKDMHVAIDGERAAFTALESGFLNVSDGVAEAHWNLGKVYYNGEDAWLVQTITSDDGYEQKFYLKVVRRGKGALVRIDEASSPYLTPGVRGAVEAAAACLSRS